MGMWGPRYASKSIISAYLPTGCLEIFTPVVPPELGSNSLSLHYLDGLSPFPAIAQRRHLTCYGSFVIEKNYTIITYAFTFRPWTTNLTKNGYKTGSASAVL